MPPDAVTVTVDDPPLQRIAVALADMLRAVGSLILIDVEVEQPLASVTLKV